MARPLVRPSLDRYRLAPGKPKKTFWSFVEKTGGCWNWLGSINAQGYGQANIAGKTVRAHRASYEAIVGPIPGGLQIDHICKNRRCVNPRHLEPVTAQVNTDRKLRSKTELLRVANILRRKPGGLLAPPRGLNGRPIWSTP